MRVVWTEQEGLESGGGHGVDFFAVGRRREGPFAVLRGFEWYHGRPETVGILIEPESDAWDGEFLAEARKAIEAYVTGPGMLNAHKNPSPQVWAGING